MSRLKYSQTIRNIKNSVSKLGVSFVVISMSLGGALPAIFSQTADAATPSDLYVVQGGTGNCSSLAQACGSITTAVNAADASGGTVIHVAAGAYAETVNVNKPVIIDGAEAGVAGASPIGTPRVGLETRVTAFNISSSNVTVDGFSLLSAGIQMNINPAAAIGSGIVVEDNIFENYASVGMPTENAGNLLIQGNYFTSPASNSEPMQIKANAVGGCSNTTIENNVFNYATNNGSADINFSCTGSNSVGVTITGNNDLGNTNGTSFVSLAGISSVNITNNTVVNSSGSAIFFWGGVSGTANITNNSITNGAGSAISLPYMGADYGYNSGIFNISSNNLSNNAKGVSLGDSFSPGASVSITNNNLSGNNIGVNDASSSLNANATKNWWGDASGPLDTNSLDGSSPASNNGSGSAVVGRVNYGPWCTVADCSSTLPLSPTNTEFIGPNTTTLKCNSFVSSTLSNTLQFVWTDPSGTTIGHRTFITYPDNVGNGYAYTNSTNVWLDRNGNTFGQHGSGLYSYAVQDENAAGQWSNPTTCILYYDTIKPIVSFTAPTPPNNSYENGNFQVGYAASDNIELKSVNVSLFDTNPAHTNHWVTTCYSNSNETSATDNGTCTVDIPSSLANGTYYVQVGAQDQAGNWSVNAIRTIIVDHNVPAAPTNLSAKFQYDSNSVSNGSTLNITAKPGNNNLELLWNAPVNDWVTGYHILATFPNGSTNTFYQGPNTNAWLATYDGFGNYGNGKYSYQVQSVNPNGNSTSSSSFILYYDTQPPTASFTSAPANNSSLNGNFDVSGTAQDNVGLNNVFFDVRTQSGSSWVAGCLSGGAPVYSNSKLDATLSCTIDTSHLVDGVTYMLRIHANDNAGYGNVNSDAVRYFTFDTTPPVAKITSPLNGEVLGYINNGTVNINGSVTDNNPGHYYLKITGPNGYSAGSGTVYDSSSFTNKVLYAWNLNGLSDGTYTIDLEARDAAGNKNAGSINTIQVMVDNSSPTVSFSNNNSTIIGTNEITPNVVATDNTAITYMWTANNLATSTNVSISDPTAMEPSLTVKSGAYGTYSLTLTVTDQGGNATSEIFIFTYSAPPVFTPLTLTSPTTTNNDSNQNTQNNGHVLGASTTVPDTTTNGNVKGASTNAKHQLIIATSTKFLGLGWWWLAVIAAIILILAVRMRRSSEHS